MSKLYTLYWERFEDEPGISLDAYLEEVVAGKHGSFSREQIVDFIHEVEEATLQNIENKAMESPSLAARKGEAIAHLEAQTERLLAKFGEKSG